jgi:hypothetical protein
MGIMDIKAVEAWLRESKAKVDYGIGTPSLMRAEVNRLVEALVTPGAAEGRWEGFEDGVVAGRSRWRERDMVGAVGWMLTALECLMGPEPPSTPGQGDLIGQAVRQVQEARSQHAAEMNQGGGPRGEFTAAVFCPACQEPHEVGMVFGGMSIVACPKATGFVLVPQERW